jgi:diguanylate cyclase (GGDEF)-like protein
VTPRETILCVDDEEGVLHALRQQLGARFGHECAIATASSGVDALELFDELERDGDHVAVIIADQIMPGMKGVDLLEHVDRRSPTTTKILLTGQAGLDAVISAINRAHLNHYINKPWDEASRHLIATLSAKNQALLEMNRELEAKVQERTHELAEANSRLAQLAVTDGLTGLYNHRHFHERLSLEVERSARNGLPLSLLMVDVDHFKFYNDHHGHPAGDEVLRNVARLIKRCVRQEDVACRLGGEEFGVIVRIDGREGARAVAERMRKRIEETPVHFGGVLIPITASAGIATAAPPHMHESPTSLLAAADRALYRAKDDGRNRCEE